MILLLHKSLIIFTCFRHFCQSERRTVSWWWKWGQLDTFKTRWLINALNLPKAYWCQSTNSYRIRNITIQKWPENSKKTRKGDGSYWGLVAQNIFPFVRFSKHLWVIKLALWLLGTYFVFDLECLIYGWILFLKFKDVKLVSVTKTSKRWYTSSWNASGFRKKRGKWTGTADLRICQKVLE